MRSIRPRTISIGMTAAICAVVACSSGSTSHDSGPGGNGGQGGGAADAAGDSAGPDAAAGAGGGRGGQGGQAPDAGAGTGGHGGEPTCIQLYQSCSVITPVCCSGSMCTGGTCMLIHVSDRNAKRDFAQVNNDEILEGLAKLPLSTWSYKSEDSGARHIGPMAQDFMATFHVGATDKAIFQVDGDGVAFAAIQALNERVKRLTEENATLRRELSQIRSDLARERRPRPRTGRGAPPN